MNIINFRTVNLMDQLNILNVDMKIEGLTLASLDELINIEPLAPSYILTIEGDAQTIHATIDKIWNACDCAFYRVYPANYELRGNVKIDVYFPKDEWEEVSDHLFNHDIEYSLAYEYITKEGNK